jgi:hypothetical protein
MKSSGCQSHNVLFVYAKDDSGTFWVNDGRQYLRFYWNKHVARFVRRQAYLPAQSEGSFIEFSDADRDLLEHAAKQYHLTLPFFDSPDECLKFELGSHSEQYIFDRSYPAGYFFASNNLEQRNDEE